MAQSLTFEHTQTQEDTLHYGALVDLLADMVEAALSSGRYLVVRKPRFDADRWLRRYLTMEVLKNTDRELTAKLLGTDKFKRVA